MFNNLRRTTIATQSHPAHTPESIKDLIVNSLDDDKAEDIIAIDLQGKTAIADYMVIASGRSTRQVVSLAQKLSEKLHKDGLQARIEGKDNGDWVLVDAGDVIVHLFRPEVRSFYGIEKIWGVDFGDAGDGQFVNA